MMPVRTTVAALALAATMAAAATARAEPRQYELDPEHTVFALLVMHIGYARTLGFFREVEGSFTFDEEAREIPDVRITVATDSVLTDHEARDGHLRSADFLHAEEHPEMTFVMTDAQPAGPNTGTITGDLTLRGVTQPVTLDVTLNKVAEYPFGSGAFGKPNYVAGVSARGTIQRSDFGMTYAVDNGLVGDEVELIIEFEAIRQE